MRCFEVWLDKNLAGVEPDIVIVEMPDNATDAECEAECMEALDVLIGNNLDTGWREIEASISGK